MGDVLAGAHIPKISVKREILWSGGHFTIKVHVDERIRKGIHVGGPYVKVKNPRIAVDNVPSFVHSANRSELKRFRRRRTNIICGLEVAKSTYNDGSTGVSLDYRQVHAATTATRWVRVVTSDDIGIDLGGLLPEVIISLPDGTGAILIGRK